MSGPCLALSYSWNLKTAAHVSRDVWGFHVGQCVAHDLSLCYRCLQNTCPSKTYEVIGFGAPSQFIWFGDAPGPRPCKVIEFRRECISQTPVLYEWNSNIIPNRYRNVALASAQKNSAGPLQGCIRQDIGLTSGLVF